jgi:aspartyl-tRNA(Asn)/glutamyl-tRNA(Gln) amidotransferase subunit B
MNDKYDLIIGLEIHIQTKTESKMFCGCAAEYFEKEPNTQVCPVCLGLPGALPVPNKRAIEKCILLGLATNSKISEKIRFDRKHYFYPDLPKGYQISQYDNPVCSNGYVDVDGTNVEIERIHQEEDVAKSIHKGNYTLVDFNKSGVPLIEIVTKPTIRNAKQAKAFASKIRQIVRYLDISDADMEKGQMRCEPNISVQEKGTWKYEDGKILPLEGKKLNSKIEVKNIGSISAVEKSIDFEVQRLIKKIEQKEPIKQETRGWNATKNVSEFQRSKETAEDYRYLPDPDIPVIRIGNDVLEKVKEELVELPEDKISKYIQTYNLSEYDAKVLTASKENASFYEKLLEEIGDKKAAKTAANLLTGVIFSYVNNTKNSLLNLHLSMKDLASLIIKVEKKELLHNKAKEILSKSLNEKKNLGDLLKESSERGLYLEGEIEALAKEVLMENQSAVEDYKNGKVNVIGFLIGQLMKKAKGNANPQSAKEILEKLLK